MARNLTVDYAETVELPTLLHPKARQQRVKELLQDQDLLGPNVHVDVDKRVIVDEENYGVEEPIYPRDSSFPFKQFLGRRALVEVAHFVQMIDNSVPMRTEGYA